MLNFSYSCKELGTEITDQGLIVVVVENPSPSTTLMTTGIVVAIKILGSSTTLVTTRVVVAIEILGSSTTRMMNITLVVMTALSRVVISIVVVIVVILILILIVIVIVVIIVLVHVIMDNIMFIPEWAGAGRFLVLPFFPTGVAEFIAAPGKI
jgi:hypothetical protein